MDANTRLSSAFVKKAKQSLKRKRFTKRGLYPLPFVTTSSNSPCWHVPATGGYFGGHKTGSAMAHFFLKYLREEKNDLRLCLADIIQSFMIRFEQEGGQAMRACRSHDRSDEFDSFRGQFIGFCYTISAYLNIAAKQFGSPLDELTEEELLHRANAGLGFDEAAYMASLDRDEE